MLLPEAPNKPLEPGVHEFQPVFGAQIDGRVVDGDIQTPNLRINIRPEVIAEEGVQDVRISEDGLTLVVNIDVPANTIFELVVGAYPGNPDNQRLTYFIGTVELPTGSISGSVAVVAEGLDPITGGLSHSSPPMRSML